MCSLAPVERAAIPVCRHAAAPSDWSRVVARVSMLGARNATCRHVNYPTGPVVAKTATGLSQRASYCRPRDCKHARGPRWESCRSPARARSPLLRCRMCAHAYTAPCPLLASAPRGVGALLRAMQPSATPQDEPLGPGSDGDPSCPDGPSPVVRALGGLPPSSGPQQVRAAPAARREGSQSGRCSGHSRLACTWLPLARRHEQVGALTVVRRKRLISSSAGV